MGKKAIILATVAIMIIAVVFFEFYVFQMTESYSTAYYNEFNNTPTTSYNYSFSPPVSMYRALLIALESGGWNATSLQNMTVNAELDYCAFDKDGSFMQIHTVTSPPADWSPQQVNGTTYRYVWTITVEQSGFARSIPPPGLYWVDAATAELVTGPILL
jgi:hypothetical protein